MTTETAGLNAHRRQPSLAHRFSSPSAIPVIVIFVAVLIANLPALLHLVTTNPLVLDANLIPPTSGLLPGMPYIDPNAGYTVQSLGHLSALDWLHGHIPWWNPFEGIGSPLAGEMQSGAFFPATLLLAWKNGLLFLQILLETVSGWATYLLARRLSLGRLFSTVAGTLFALCGTFSWLAHAPIRPIPLLPLCLLGVEYSIGAATDRRRFGWRLLAISFALSVLAGFPESTFINALFVAWWAFLRTVMQNRSIWWVSVRKIGTGVLLGTGLSLPLIVAFVDYLPYANVGPLNGSFAHASIQTYDLVHIILPYSLGPLFGLTAPPGASFSLEPGTSGFLSATIIAAGIIGLLGKRNRILRIGLGAWIAVCLLRTFGFTPVVDTMAVIPGVRNTAFFLWSDPSWELASILLAVMGLDDILRRQAHRSAIVIATLATASIAGWAAFTAWPLLSMARGPSGHTSAANHLYAVGSLIGACTMLGTLLLGAIVFQSTIPITSSRPGRRQRERQRVARRRKLGSLLMAGAITAESFLLFEFTYLSAPPPTDLELGSVSWLQGHLGQFRFFTLGPIQPNYGSYFNIAEANINDIPVPKSWNDYIESNLASNALVDNFTGVAVANPNGASPAQQLSSNITNYEAAGIRYVVEEANGADDQGHPFPPVGSPPWPKGPRLVYKDQIAQIWQLPSSAPVYSLDYVRGSSPSRPCSILRSSWDDATIGCGQPATLIRRVQYMPGWTATFDGISTSVQPETVRGIDLFQRVSLPPGRTTIQFTFLPPWETPAITAAIIAGFLLALSFAWRQVARPVGFFRHRRKHKSGTQSEPDESNKRLDMDPQRPTSQVPASLPGQ